MSLRTIVLNSAAGYAANFVLMGIGILTKILLARMIAPADFGILISAQTITVFAISIASLGLTDAVVREVALDRGRGAEQWTGIVIEALKLVFPAALLVTLALFVSAHWIGQAVAAGEEAFPLVLILLALSVPFKMLADMFGAVCQGIGKYWLKVLALDLAPAAFVLAVLAALMAIGQGSVDKVAAIYLASGIVSSLVVASLGFGVIRVRRQASSISRMALLRYGLPLLGSGIVAWPLALVPVAIGGLIAPESVAYYSLAISLASFIYLGTSVAEAASFGTWAEYVGESRRDQLLANYRVVTRWGLILASLVFVPLFFCSGDVVMLVYGAGYLPVAELLPLLATIFLVNAATGPNESILKSLGCTQWIFASRFAVGATVAAVLYPLVTRYGLYGAIASYFLTVLVGVGMYGGYLFRNFDIHPIDQYFLRVTAAIAVALIAVSIVVWSVLEAHPGISRIAWVAALYVLLVGMFMYLLRAYTDADRQLIDRIIVHLRGWKA